MPVPERLSRLLQERFGEEAGRDLVEWLNQIEKARLDAGLEHRLDLLEIRILTAVERLESRINSRLR